MTTHEKLHASRIWWKGLSLERKFYKVIPWLKSKDMGAADKHPDDLTSSEILEVWMLEKF